MATTSAFLTAYSISIYKPNLSHPPTSAFLESRLRIVAENLKKNLKIVRQL